MRVTRRRTSLVIRGWRCAHRFACGRCSHEADDQAQGEIVEHNPDEGRHKDEGSETIR